MRELETALIAIIIVAFLIILAPAGIGFAYARYTGASGMRTLAYTITGLAIGYLIVDQPWPGGRPSDVIVLPKHVQPSASPPPANTYYPSAYDAAVKKATESRR